VDAVKGVKFADLQIGPHKIFSGADSEIHCHDDLIDFSTPKQYVPRNPPVKGLPQVDGRLHYSLSKIKDIFYPTLTSLIYLIPGSSPMVGEPSGGGPTANLPIPSSFRSEGPQPVSPDSSIHIECRDPLHLRFRYKMYSSELSPDFLRNRGEFARGKSRPSPVGHIIFIRHDYI